VKRVLLLSAYEARSHQHWAAALQSMFPEWDWTVLALPARHFSWRVRGNPLYWSRAQRHVLEQSYDVVLATSLVDLATLRGLVPKLNAALSCVYFHENQFAYPSSAHQSDSLEATMVSLYSALAVDRVLFNSQFNRDSFLEGLGELLNKLPDYVPPGVAHEIAEKAVVLPVPIAPPPHADHSAWPGGAGRDSNVARLAWLGRFEYDKGPDGLFETLKALEQDGFDYELAVVGQQFRRLPPAMEAIRSQFSHRVVQLGYIDDPMRYRALTGSADIALSTALHEFQGLAILEAVAAGATPCVPDRQAYPEIFGPAYRYPVSASDPAAEGQAAAKKIQALFQARRSGTVEQPDVSGFYTSNLCESYRAALGS
jgi:glycosyltransferase involved in cell wall biosynthesis